MQQDVQSPCGRSPRSAADSSQDRWRDFSITEVKEATFKLDRFKWLKDDEGEDEGELPDPEEITARLLSRLQTAKDEVKALHRALEGLGGGG